MLSTTLFFTAILAIASCLVQCVAAQTSFSKPDINQRFQIGSNISVAWSTKIKFLRFALQVSQEYPAGSTIILASPIHSDTTSTFWTPKQSDNWVFNPGQDSSFRFTLLNLDTKELDATSNTFNITSLVTTSSSSPVPSSTFSPSSGSASTSSTTVLPSASSTSSNASLSTATTAAATSVPSSAASSRAESSANASSSSSTAGASGSTRPSTPSSSPSSTGPATASSNHNLVPILAIIGPLLVSGLGLLL